MGTKQRLFPITTDIGYHNGGPVSYSEVKEKGVQVGKEATKLFLFTVFISVMTVKVIMNTASHPF